MLSLGEPGLCRTWSETQIVGFLMHRLISYVYIVTLDLYLYLDSLPRRQLRERPFGFYGLSGWKMFSGLCIFFIRDAVLSFYLYIIQFTIQYNLPCPIYYFRAKLDPGFFKRSSTPHPPPPPPTPLKSKGRSLQ